MGGRGASSWAPNLVASCESLHSVGPPSPFTPPPTSPATAVPHSPRRPSSPPLYQPIARLLVLRILRTLGGQSPDGIFYW